MSPPTSALCLGSRRVIASSAEATEGLVQLHKASPFQYQIPQGEANDGGALHGASDVADRPGDGEPNEFGRS